MNAAVTIVRGQPDELEVAALVAGLAAASSVASAERSEPVEPARSRRWIDQERRTSAARPGLDEWRWSLRR